MAKSTKDILIRILTQGDSSGVEQVSGDIQELGSRVEKAGKKMSLFLTAPLVGAAGVGFGALIKRGVEFNSLLEDSETAIQAVLQKFGGPEMQNAEARSRAAAGGIEELKRQAREAPGTIQGLVQGLTAISGPGLAAGLSLEQLIDLTVKFSQANSRLGLSEQQLVQESRALINGNVTLDAALAQTLGVTNENIRAAKEQGNLYQFLVDQLGPLAQAADTTSVRFSNLVDVIDQIAGKISEPVFEGLSEGALNVAEAVAQMDPSDLEQLGRAVAGLVETGVDLTTWFIELDPTARKAAAGLLVLLALAGPLTTFAGILMQTSRGASQLANILGLLGSNAKLAKVPLSGLGGIISLFAASGAAGYGIGTAIDNLTGFSDSIEKSAKKAAKASTDLEGDLFRKVGALRDQAREMENINDLEEVRAVAIRQRGIFNNEFQRSMAAGDEEAAARMDNYIGQIDRLLDSLGKVLTLNQTRQEQQEEVNTATELQVELLLEGVGLTMSQIERQEHIVKLHNIEMKILAAKKAGNEDLVKQLEQQKREQQLLNQYKAAKFTDEEATEMAKARAQAEFEAAKASENRLRTTREIITAEKEAEQTRKLRRGVEAREFIDLDGKRKQEYYEGGRRLGDSDDFGFTDDPVPQAPLPSEPFTSPQGTDAPQAPAPARPQSVNTSGMIQAINQIEFDDRGIIQALIGLEQRFNGRFSNIESQIQQLGN
ncbi:MAG: hypothetical protein ACPGSB_03490 [Opitutales bacterium]